MPTQAAFNTISPSGSDQHWRIPAGTSAVLIMSASQNQRAGGSIFNHSPNSLYLKFGGSPYPSANSFDVKMPSGSFYEMLRPPYQGEVYGVWDGTSGFAMVMTQDDSEY